MADETASAPAAEAQQADSSEAEAPSADALIDMSEDALLEHVLSDVPDDAPSGDQPETVTPAGAPEGAAETKPDGDQGGDDESVSDGSESSEKATEETDDGPHERAWNTIRRKEKELVDARADIKRDKEAIELERGQFQKLGDSVRQMQAEVRQDPLGFIQRAAGYSMDDLVKLALGEKPAPSVAPATPEQRETESPMAKELAELKALVQQQANERVLGEYRSNVNQTLDDPAYELLQGYRVMTTDGHTLSAAQVIEHRAGLAAQAGEQDLTPKVFADRLLSEFREDLAKQASHGAVRKVLGLSDAPASPEATNGSGQSTPQTTGAEPTNLTNSLGTTPRRAAPEEAPDPFDEDAIIGDAIRAMPE